MIPVMLTVKSRPITDIGPYFSGLKRKGEALNTSSFVEGSLVLSCAQRKS